MSRAFSEPRKLRQSYTSFSIDGLNSCSTASGSSDKSTWCEIAALTAWASDFAAEEFASLKPNRELMEKIARQTGGEVIDEDKLAAFAAKLPQRRAPVMETTAQPLWHTSWVFLLALACFLAEWGLRRKSGLA